MTLTDEQVEELYAKHATAGYDSKWATTAMQEAFRLGVEQERARCALIAENETVPDEGGMPSEIILRVLAQDTSYVEKLVRATVIATKSNIKLAIERGQ